MRLPRFDYPLPPRQRGVFGLMAAGLMLLMVISVALAVDTGRLFLEQRHMQRVADLAALEAAGAVPLISYAEDGELKTAAQGAARRNGHDDAEAERSLKVIGGGVCHAPEGEGKVRVFFALEKSVPAVACDDGYSGTLERHAVEVTASHQVRPSLFGSLLGEDEITISATAMAQRSQAEQFAVFSVGSRLVSIDTGDSLLGPLLSQLGLNVSGDVIGFGGIADATVMLGDLVAVDQLGVGSVDELLTTEVRLLDLVSAIATAADDDSVAELDLPDLLGVSIREVRVALGDIVHVASDSSPLSAELNVLDLLQGMLLLANQGAAIELENLGIDVGEVTNINATLTVIEPPQIAIGPAGCLNDVDPAPSCDGDWKTEARTAQVEIELNADVKVPLLANLQLGATVRAGGARAGVESIDIPEEGPEKGKHEWDVSVAAYSLPVWLSTTVGAGLLSGRTYLPWLEDESLGKRGNLDKFLGNLFGVDSDSSLVLSLLNSLLQAVSGLLGAVVDILKGIIDSLIYCSKETYVFPGESSYVGESGYLTGASAPTAGTEIWVRKELKGVSSCKPPKHSKVKDAPSFKGVEEKSGPVELPNKAWGEGGAMAVKKDKSDTLAWPKETLVTFESNLKEAVTLNVADFSINVANRQGVELSGLLTAVLGLLENVVEKVILRVAGPLLNALGVGLGEADVKVYEISDATGPPELL